jgi:hypothetical protein
VTVHNLRAVFGKATSEWEFAQELLDDAESACAAAGINLTASEKQILNTTLRDIKEYYGLRLYVVSQLPDIPGNLDCVLGYGCVL